MEIQVQVGGTCSNTILPDGSRISLNSQHSVTGIQLNEQLYSGDDLAPKARKPYTITKQRERWTEDEHKKFIEALKLHGRAWRRIEEHVGTKTAVQIRSHAQKFFSKVVRESTCTNMSSGDPMEIPPPRPKRKPVHPYPRKPVDNGKKGTSTPEQPIRSPSPIYSISEKENQSPTSVLSVVGSETLGSMDSNPQNVSPSPASSASDVNRDSLLLSEPNSSPGMNAFPSPLLEKDCSVQNEQLPLKIELSTEDNVFAKEGSAEVASTRSIKLFGRTVLVPDTKRPSSPTMESFKLEPSEFTVGKLVQTQPWDRILASSQQASTECARNHLPLGVQGGFYNIQFQSGRSNLGEAGSASPLPWWTFNGGVPVSFPSPILESAKAHTESNTGEVQVKGIQKEGSWTGSNTGSGNEGEYSDKGWDVETQSVQHAFEEKKELNLVPKNQLSEKSSFCEQKRASQGQGARGFVPYKRCLSERDTHSSTITGEGREEQRIRLCL